MSGRAVRNCSNVAIMAEVGHLYLVPCMYVDPEVRTSWMPVDGWVPIFGPRHSDAEELQFPVEHYHVDWRFVPEAAFKWACRPYVPTPLGQVLSKTDRSGLNGVPVPKRRKCRRPMPIFPRVTLGESGMRWKRLEQAMTKSCSRLKPGNICPHRGIDLTPYAAADGTAVCPGHGLRWNLTTGQLIRRHGADRASPQPPDDARPTGE